MKLVCNVYVYNRQLPLTSLNNKRKHVKSTLALCKHPNNNEFSIILFSGVNKSGTKYKLNGNILQVLNKFVNDGKTTIQFKVPPHDIQIQSETIQLKSFLHLLKRALENNLSDKELKYSSMAVTAVKPKDIPPVKMAIKKRSDYPTKGFPRTLEILYINDVRRCSLDRGILQLTKLRVLDLSNNCIEYLPEELNKLPNLKQLNISYNLLGRAKVNQWKWIGGNFSKNLLVLDLSYNELTYIPDQISKLHKLNSLNLNNNQLKILPFGIGNLHCLKIFSASHNLLSYLPGSIRKCSLQSIDLSHNPFEECGGGPNVHYGFYPNALGVCTLKEYAARRALLAKIPYGPDMIPLTLVDYLDKAKYCVCGKPCFSVFIRHSTSLLLSNISEMISVSGSAYVPIDCFSCSVRCYRSTFRTSNRNRVI